VPHAGDDLTARCFQPCGALLMKCPARSDDLRANGLVPNVISLFEHGPPIDVAGPPVQDAISDHTGCG
jgi:hypothetical protein